jgi:EKC/KEOPS complex subunit CGI121/TPRKB
LTPTHLLSASFHALHLFLTSRAKSRTPHSELVFRLHPNNNIGQSYSSFGISDTSTNIIAVKFGNLPITLTSTPESEVTNASVSEHLGRVVEGEGVQIGEGGEELGEFCDVERVRKVYKLAGVGKRGGVDEKKELESVVLGIMTIKGS